MFEHLTDEQRLAVTHSGAHLCIMAGAGTGKTSTLAARLAHLVEQGVAPERVLLLTFSRRAAAEMLYRVEHMTGRDVSGAVWGGTFHAIANRLLRRHGRALGIDPDFTVLDAADTADLLAMVRDEVHDSDDCPESRRARKETMAEIVSRCVNSRAPLPTVLLRTYPWCADQLDELRATFVAYTARKRARHLLDYDDLLLCWWGLLRHADTAAVLQGRFEHVLVDEYQDTNALQADIVALQVAGGATLTVVGDDAQAIYSFRAATPDNILSFADRFSADVVTLTRNHRSSPEILATANAVMAEAARRHPKDLRSTRPPAARPTLVRCHDEMAQSAAVCRRVLDHHERGIALRRQAVLVRTGHHTDLLELELQARNIPFVKFGGLRFLEAAHVKDLIAALRLVENPHDELAWLRVLLLLEGVGRATARRLTDRLLALPSPLLAELADHPATDLITTLRSAAGSTGSPGTQVECVRVWLDPMIRVRYRDAAPRLDDLDQLTAAAASAPSLERFLVELTLDPPAVTGDLAGPPHLDDDVLTLSTVHSAKGGEWDVVHLLHLADGCFPSDLATGDADAVEEERRLLYVAVTRARDHLHAYVPLRYHHSRGKRDKHGYAAPSRFLTPSVLATFDEPAADQPAAGSAGSDGSDRPTEVGSRYLADARARLAALDAEVASLWG